MVQSAAHIKTEHNDFLLENLKKQIIDIEHEYNDETLIKICQLLKERIQFISELKSEASYFFSEPESYPEKVLRKKCTNEGLSFLA